MPTPPALEVRVHAPPEPHFNEGDRHQQQIRGKGKIEPVLDLRRQSKERQQVADDLVREGVGPVLQDAGVLQHHDQGVARDLAAAHRRVEGADDALQRPSNRNLCEINIYGAFAASTSTPSTRHLLDGVAMPVPRRSTEHPTHWLISTQIETATSLHA